MRVIVTTEERFERGDDGVIRSATGAGAYGFWQRYREVFDSVCVLGRVTGSQRQAGQPVEGPGVSVVPLPGYHGPAEYLRYRSVTLARVRAACAPGAAIILRCPGAVAGLLVREVRRQGLPYGVEVLGDPYDVFASGAVRHPLRPFFRRWFSRQLRRQCAGACAAAYVTARTLQQRYPPPAGAMTTHYSSVELPEAAFADRPRHATDAAGPRTLISVGSMAQHYKGLDVLIHAITQCARNGLDLRLVLVGDGRLRGELERLARTLGDGDRVLFRGELPAGQAVRDELDRADLYVQPSRTEGLPRAMLEAMARGLPCIGSSVGGIPELVQPQDLFPPGEAPALAAKIREVLADSAKLAAMSARNLETAREYSADRLARRRRALYEHVKSVASR